MQKTSSDGDWSRRTFVKASLLTLLALSGGPNAWGSLFGEQQRSAASLNLLHTHTGERLAVTYRNAGCRDCDPEALDRINHLLRCHYTDEVHPIDVRTLDYLTRLDQHLGGGNEIHVVSGYRSPSYNEKLRHRGHGVARNSLHLLGKALDIRIPGIELSTLRRIALGLQLGGVGFYPRPDFLHIDSGQFRIW